MLARSELAMLAQSELAMLARSELAMLARSELAMLAGSSPCKTKSASHSPATPSRKNRWQSRAAAPHGIDPPVGFAAVGFVPVGQEGSHS
jgi:hypothetical protein